MPTEDLCHGLPNEFATYLEYTRSLGFDKKPDYNYLRKIFCDLFVGENLEHDNGFDWTTRGKLVDVNSIVEKLWKCESESRRRVEKLSANNNPLTDGQWRELSDLHRRLLHEYHDFMLASKHLPASHDLRRVAQEKNVPARIWLYGTQNFLKLLRHRQPVSRAYMLTFIYAANSIFATLYENVPEFEHTWVECLGDLSRYRMLIEANQRLSDAWTATSRRWYTLAFDRAPDTGRLYYDFVIVARPVL